MTNLFHKTRFIALTLLVIIFASCAQQEEKFNEWITIFDGKDLNNWKINEHPETFSVEDGKLKANGDRSHIFYEGDFDNFEIAMEVLSTPGSNSGIFIHTQFQDEGWPAHGYEAQVNTSHIGGGDYRELKKTGSLYSVRNIYKKLVPDDEWYNYRIKVIGNHVQIYINDMLTVNYFEPPQPVNPADSLKRLSHGTFAIQGHDPESTVFFKNIKVKRLPQQDVENINPVVFDETYKHMMGLQSQQHSFTDLGIMYDDDLDLDEAMNFFFRTGINLGIVIDLSGNNVAEDVKDHINKLSTFPIFVGGYLEAADIDTELIADLDYVVGPAGNLALNKGNAEVFMKNYVVAIVDDLNAKPINIWTGATTLPDDYADQYDQLWTEDRMNQVIDAAVSNNIAIAIDNEKRIPSVSFIQLAKAKGAKFTYANLDVSNGMGNLDYIFEVIEKCGLDYKDIYIP